MNQDTINSDKQQLAHIRDRINILWQIKEQMEVASQGRPWFKDLKCYIDVVAELFDLDEQRTLIVNPNSFTPTAILKTVEPKALPKAPCERQQFFVSAVIQYNVRGVRFRPITERNIMGAIRQLRAKGQLTELHTKSADLFVSNAVIGYINMDKVLEQ
jgi:hypothetical protein